MEFVQRSRGVFKLKCDGYLCVKPKKLANAVVSYECELRRNDQQCKTKLKVARNDLVDRMNKHTHAPDAGHAEASGSSHQAPCIIRRGNSSTNLIPRTQ